MADEKKRGRKPSSATQLARKIDNKNKPKEKTTPASAVQVCTCCDNYATKSSLEKVFYISYSPFHRRTGRVPLCKECIVKNSTRNGVFSFEMFIEVLREIDKPYFETELEGSINQVIKENSKDGKEFTKEMALRQKADSIIGYYIKNIALNFKDMMFMDGDARKTINPTVDLMSSGEYESIEIEYLRERWGHELPVDDLKFLEEKYNEWESGYEVDTKNRQLIVENLVYEELFIYKERQQGKDVSKRLKNIKDLMGLGNLSPRQETDSESAEFNSFPAMIAHVEKNRVCYIENHALKDIDNMEKNIKILDGLIARSAGNSNENTKIFEEEYSEETMDLTTLAGGE